MFGRKLDAEARVALTVYAGQVVAFALGALHYGL
jgi:hypothetical protein